MLYFINECNDVYAYPGTLAQQVEEFPNDFHFPYATYEAAANAAALTDLLDMGVDFDRILGANGAYVTLLDTIYEECREENFPGHA